MADFRKTSRQIQAPEVPVLHKRLRRVAYHGWIMVIRIRYAVVDVDNLVVRAECE